ncbi:MAG TPA: RDD family protein [Candidatus Dormibacteraeota bacterium]|jgi:uncharacterized RDD family membrane protein YckC|nr:RDD family protein [Candidatus Dormibacteraeota bacterium]
MSSLYWTPPPPPGGAPPPPPPGGAPPPPPPGGAPPPPPPGGTPPPPPPGGTPPPPPPGGAPPPPPPGEPGYAPPPPGGPAYTPPGYGAPLYPGPVPTAIYGGFWRRLAALILDGLIYGIPAAIVALIISAPTRVDYQRLDALIDFVFGLAYFTYLWANNNGQTLGYQALGIRLVRADGTPVTPGVAAVRFILIEISFALCLIPAIVSAFMVGLGQRKQAIHDLIMGTLVVRSA